MARVPRVRRHPQIRPALLASEETEIRKNLLMDGIPAEFHDLLPKLVDRYPEFVVDLLARSSRELLGALDPLVLKPLLASEDEDVRQRAFEVIGRMGVEVG